MKSLFWVIAGVYFVLVALGVIQFHLWDQVEYLYAMHIAGAELWSLKLEDNWIRFMLVYPIYAAGEWLPASANYIFSLLLSFCLIIIAKLTANIVKILWEAPAEKSAVFSLVFFLMLSLLMNGRIVFALLGMGLMLYHIVKWYVAKELDLTRTLILVPSALLLSAVSTGTFFVVAMLFFYWTGIMARYQLRIDGVRQGDGLLYAFFAITPLIILFMFESVEKNLRFFGGGLEGWGGAVEHGLGSVLLQASLYLQLMFILLLGIAVVVIGVRYAKECKKIEPVLVAMSLGLIGGIFGYSTLAMAIPATLVLCMLLLKKAGKKYCGHQDCS